MKTLTLKRPTKDVREKLVLFGLVELYLKTAKPIASNVLKEKGFIEGLSPATIRNYFAKLEEEGYLKQQHSSGGRIPTAKAFKAYALTHLNDPVLSVDDKKNIEISLKKQTREVASYLMQALESVSHLTNCAAFLSAPRFDHDFILEIKAIQIDDHRLLCVLITDFGTIRTEVLHTDKKCSSFALKRLEAYFNFRLTGIEKPALDAKEEHLGARLYKELLLRHIVGYTNFSSEDLFQAGFSKLLSYPDFNDAAALASGLSLFENKQMLRQLLSETTDLSCWVGEDLMAFSPDATHCSVITIPYYINQTLCGAIGILGPSRIPYRELFGKLRYISEILSDALTRSLYKFKISFRSPKISQVEFHHHSHALLLEKKTYPKENS